MGNITINAEQVSLDLDARIDEPSTAKIEVEIGQAGNGWATTTLSIFGSADNEDQNVWLNISRHTYASMEVGEPLSVNSDVMAHRFTRAEAEALLEVLKHELGKL